MFGWIWIPSLRHEYDGYLKEEEEREGLVWAFVSYDLDTRFSHAWETIVGLCLYEHDTRFTN